MENTKTGVEFAKVCTGSNELPKRLCTIYHWTRIKLSITYVLPASLSTLWYTCPLLLWLPVLQLTALLVQWSCDRAQVRKMFVMLVEKERKQPTVVAVAAQALAAAGP